MYREIVFRLSVDKHPDLGSQLSGFADMVRKTYAEIGKQSAVLSATAGGSMSGTAPGVGQASVTQTTQARVQAERASGAAVAAATGDIAEVRARVEEVRQKQELAKLNKFLKEKEELATRYQEATKILEEHAAAAGDPEIAKLYWDTLEKARAAYYDKDADLAEKAEAEREKLMDRAMVRRLKALQDEEKAKERAAKQAADEAKQQARELESLDAKYQAAQGRIRSSKREITSTFAELGGSIMRVTRGVTALGLAGEADMEKIVKGLLKVQGAFDIVSGGLQVWVKMQQVIEGVRKMLLATAAAEELLAAATAKRALVQGVANATGGAGAVGGAIGGAAKNIGEMTAGTLLAKGLRSFGGKALGAAGGLAAGATVGIAGGLAADFFSGDGYSPGGFGEKVGGGFLSPSTLGRMDKWMGKKGGQGSGLTSGSTFVDLVDSEDALKRQQEATTGREAMFKAQAAVVAKELPKVVQGFANARGQRAGNLAADMGAIGRQNERFGVGGASAEQQARLTKEILATEREIAQVKQSAASVVGRFEEVSKAFAQEQLELEKVRRDLVVERSTMARDAAAAELESSERQLRNVEATLEGQQRTLMTMQDQLRSAKERFGLMDEDQQQLLLQDFAAAKRGDKLTPDRLRALKQLGSDEADAIVAGQAEARASAAGADVLFDKEREAISKVEADIARNVEVATDIRWEITFDEKQLKEQEANLDKAIRDGLAEQAGKTAEVVKKAFAGEFANINVRIDGVERAVANGAGGRK